MNKKIVVGFALIFVGVILSVTSVWRGGLPGQLYWNNGPVYISDQAEKGSVDITPDQISSGKQDVSSLAISTKEADIVVKRGDRFSVLTDPAEKSSVTVSSTDGLVTVTAEEKNNWSFGIKNRTKHRITITVPEKLSFDKVNLSNVNGDLTIEKQHIDNLSLSNVNGDVTVNNSKIEKSGSIDSRNGDVSMTGTDLPKVSAYSRQGDVQIGRHYQNESVSKSALTIRSTTGNIVLK